MTYGPPDGYETPSFPSLNVVSIYDRTPKRIFTLYNVGDVWRFTVIWTLFIYLAFHLAAVLIAATTHRRRPESWKYLVGVAALYLFVAGLEALMAGSIVGAILGAVYTTGYYEMNTWIPCVWAFINLLVLVISSFTIQGGL